VPPSIATLLTLALQPPPSEPDVVVEVPAGWVAFSDGDACDGVYVVVPKVPGDIAGATFWSIPFHPDGVVPEERLAEICDYGAILDGAIATKHALETKFGRALAAQPVSGFLYSATEGYALGTMLTGASRELLARDPPTDGETRAAHAFVSIGRHQRVLLGTAVKARPERDEAAFVRSIDFSYTLRRFELEDEGELEERDGPPVARVSPETEARVRDALVADARARKCIDKIAARAEVRALGLEVAIAPGGRVTRVAATSDGAACFGKPVKKGIAVAGWEHGAATVTILVPTGGDTLPP
jgi:hypothetical protein